jgi:hypothetical protein
MFPKNKFVLAMLVVSSAILLAVGCTAGTGRRHRIEPGSGPYRARAIHKY